MGEDEEYEEVIKKARSIRQEYEHDMDVVSVSFAAEHRSLGNCKMFLEKDGGYISINSKKFDKLITSLRIAVEYNDGMLDKEATSYDDVFDAFRLAMSYYRFTK